jgi:thioredoxin-related protein
MKKLILSIFLLFTFTIAISQSCNNNQYIKCVENCPSGICDQKYCFCIGSCNPGFCTTFCSMKCNSTSCKNGQNCDQLSCLCN